MATNLNSARALIKADLDHANKVLKLWADQVSELEGALAQLDAVNASRNLLHAPFQAQGATAPMLPASPAKGRVGSKAFNSNENSATRAAARSATEAKPPRKRRGPNKPKATSDGAIATGRRIAKMAKKKEKPLAVQYLDPESGKTWGGRGRRPMWIKGDPDQYLVSNRSRKADATAEVSSDPNTSQPA